MTFKRSVAVLSMACGLALLGSLLFSVSARGALPILIQPQQTDPNTALTRGRALLKQGHADQALGYLETALNLFTQSSNRRGIAAAEDGLGDLYMIQGQYKVALDHYQKSYQAFVAARGKDETNQAAANSVAGRAGSTASAVTETAGSVAANGFNANLMLAKIGDTNYRLGRLSEAGAAYAMMNVKKPESAAPKATRRECRREIVFVVSIVRASSGIRAARGARRRSKSSSTRGPCSSSSTSWCCRSFAPRRSLD